MRAGFDMALLRHSEMLIPNEAEFLALLKLRPQRHRVCCGRAPFAVPKAGSPGDSLATLKGELLQQLCRSLEVPVVIVTLGSVAAVSFFAARRFQAHQRARSRSD